MSIEYRVYVSITADYENTKTIRYATYNRKIRLEWKLIPENLFIISPSFFFLSAAYVVLPLVNLDF